MGELYIHPNCKECDNCGYVEFKSDIFQCIDEESQEIYNLCEECVDTIEEDLLDEEDLHET